MKPFAIVFSAFCIGLSLCEKMGKEPKLDHNPSAGAPLRELWDGILDKYGIPFGQFCVSTFYSMYIKLTVINLLTLAVELISTISTYNFVKSFYVASRERLRRQQMGFEDIRLQTAITNTKLIVHETKGAELDGVLRREAARLRDLRAQVRGIMEADADVTRRAAADQPDSAELVKELKYELAPSAERHDMLECSEYAEESSEHSVYSSISDPELDRECRAKIVKITNVYKVAYLRHYIKQKKQRRASKQALLKKKMESIKKLLEDWQRSLNAVISSRRSLRADDSSEVAAGDHSKPRDSDSEPDLRVGADCYDEYSAHWLQPPYTTYEEAETGVCCEVLERGYGEPQCECGGPPGGHALFLLPRLPEETASQLAVDDIHDHFDDDGFLTV